MFEELGRGLAASISRSVTAPVGRALAAMVYRAMTEPPPRVPVACPACGLTVAVLVHATRRLHRVAGGPALGTGHRDQVRGRCQCGTQWVTSGSGVARRLRKGLPALPS